MVGVEERGLEIGADAVRREQPLDCADQAVLVACEPQAARGGVEVAEERDELRQRDRLRRRPLEPRRRAQPSARRFDLRERIEAVDIARECAQGGARLPRGRLPSPVAKLELRELHVRPRERLPLADRRVEREAHRVPRAGDVAAQLARVRDPCIRGETRLEPRHRVERGERLAVAAELDERVADHAVVAGGARRERTRPPPERERFAEPVSRERERGEPARRDEIVGSEAECPPQHALRLPVPRGIAGLAGPLLVRKAEQPEPVDVSRCRPQRGLELQDETGGIGGREVGGEGLARGGPGRGRRAPTEESAEQEDGGGDARRRPCNEEPPPHPPTRWPAGAGPSCCRSR